MGLYAAKNAVLIAAQLNLGHRAARLLLTMALECWDDDNNPTQMPPRRYFASREASALALGYQAPDNGSKAAFQAVKCAIAELIDKGAIQRIRAGGNGQTAEFELLLDSRRPTRSRGEMREPVNILSWAEEGSGRPPQGASF